MNRLAVIIVGLSVVVGMRAFAQEGEDSGMNEMRPPRREQPAQDTTPLTQAQAARVKAILSKYDPNTLTADQAKAIHEAFRQAGMRAGPVMGDAIRAAGFDPERLRELAPPPSSRRGEAKTEDRQRVESDDRRPRQDGDKASERPNTGRSEQSRQGHGQYSLDQAVSDRAQLHTIAFSGLAFITGDFGASTFMPPGKVCDYFGFQYMRDIDAAAKGHNPMFLNRVAGNVLHILNDSQRKLFEDLATEQAGQFEQLALKRMPLIKAFHRELEAKTPGLNREAVTRYVGDFFAFDAELSYRRAEVFGKVAASLTPEQKAYLGKMKFGDFNTWPALDERDKLKRPAPGISRFYNVAYMTYASEFFSWYAGTVEADVYFCPERHGTYFGGFYMKDMPAMGKRDFDISTSVTGDSGEMFLKALTAEQRTPITTIPDAQRKDLSEIVEVRRTIAVELRKFLKGEPPDKQKVLSLGRRYGELDGEMSWMYAMAFARANRTLTTEQRAALKKLRNLDGYTSAPAYLYSTPMQTLPNISDTDFFFTTPGATPAAPASSSVPAADKTGFLLKSPVLGDAGQLPEEYTGDGESATLPLEWSGTPEGTKSYALIMHHLGPEGKTKWYWVLYNIPADTKSLPKNVKGVGTLGNNSVNGRTEYAPPHSKGPGAKTYVYTVYALSESVTLALKPSEISRDVLLTAMKDRILASAELKVVYTRSTGASNVTEQSVPQPRG